jgi:hypothetical protein
LIPGIFALKNWSKDEAETVSLDESVSAEEAQKVFNVIATSEVHGEWKFVLTDIEK